MERVIVIAGPTCSGKTSLSIKLAKKLKTEIISADSRQVFKYLTIGTAKPEKEEMEGIVHHFIDELYPDEDFNVSKFEHKSLEIIKELNKVGKIPIVTGGSGLYVRAITDGIIDSVDTDEEYREELHKIRNEKGNEALYEMLKKADPISAKKMLPQNWKRVMRALEVFHLSGKPIWQHHKEQKRDIDLDIKKIGLTWNRDKLYERIEKRVDIMIEKGLVQEVEAVLKMGYKKELNSLNTVGYKEIIEYLEGKIDLNRAIELIKRNTRRFAKRQLTWFRRDEDIVWFNLSEESMESVLEKIELW